ncbi:GGDEF domain-containing protein [Labrenzia sp. 011]|uniref:GGDEF domain-containing protein n=1 Tax=Labrenzia sp. 011 TaxID=2171494 RepID=UPI000D5177B0|nr:GGDEF domain-containing protein [Labrenzia sp. 011]PVB63536.1 hypothetical protein DCO57_01710 [Labrenzia sp. 011]
MQLSVLKNRLSVPSVIVILLGAILFIALAGALHFLLDRQVRSSILRHAETKATEWSSQFFGNIPEAEKIFKEGPLPEAEISRLKKSFAMVDILRLEFYDEKGKSTFVSNTPDLGPDAIGESVAQRVYRSGQPAFEIHRNEGGNQHGGPDTYVEAIFPATLPSGERIGAFEVYVDVSVLEDALEDSFREISWILIISTTIILAIPAAAYVIRTQQLRNRDMRLLELTKYDQLTGILNRNSMSETMHELFEEQESPENIGVLFVDVDFFKQVNDRFGHACGDLLLKHIADILRQSVRNSDDVVGRFGGDEFIVLCRNIDRADFERLYGRLMDKVNTPLHYLDQTYTPSLSIGAYLTQPGDTQKTALHRADLAVYAAKRGGRGQVVEYSNELEGLFKQDESRRRA